MLGVIVGAIIVAPIISKSDLGPTLQLVVLQAHIATDIGLESGPNSIFVKVEQDLSFSKSPCFSWFITFSGMLGWHPLTVPNRRQRQ